MATTTVRLGRDDEQLLDKLATSFGGRSNAIRRGLRLLAENVERQAALNKFLEGWALDVGPVDDGRRRHGAALQLVIFDAGVLISVDRGEESARLLLTALNRHGTRVCQDPSLPRFGQTAHAKPGSRRSLLQLTCIPSPTAEPLAPCSHVPAPTMSLTPIVVLAVQLRDAVLTGDLGDLATLAAALPSHRPSYEPWPCRNRFVNYQGPIRHGNPGDHTVT
jgi:Arc/MetJ-type ribon-helix-helix transcriptional regulator